MSNSTAVAIADVDKRQLRQFLGQFATGVTVMTTVNKQQHKVGMTANSFTSVSLEPPLILWNIAKSATNLTDFCECERFAVNILNEQQHSASNHFAKSSGDKFTEFAGVQEVSGVPILTDALTTLVCKNQKIIEAGDHYIILGEIETCRANTGKPLLFHNGQYHQASLHPVHQN